MESEFNPTQEDLLNLQRAILELSSKRNRLVQRKIVLQQALQSPQTKHKKELKRTVTELELELKKVNDEKNFKNQLRLEVEAHLRNNKQFASSEAMRIVSNRIEALRKKYNEFTKDKTRIASLRIMAAEFSDELAKILKP